MKSHKKALYCQGTKNASRHPGYTSTEAQGLPQLLDLDRDLVVGDCLRTGLLERERDRPRLDDLFLERDLEPERDLERDLERLLKTKVNLDINIHNKNNNNQQKIN